MQSLENYRLTLNQLYQTILTANQNVLNNNLSDLIKNQDLMDQQTQQLGNLLNSIKLDREVSRWKYIKIMLDQVQIGLNNKQKYEMKKYT
jgi:phenylalanyl-tRNA synthetase beta subunit